MLKCKICGGVFFDHELMPQRFPATRCDPAEDSETLPCGHDDYDYSIGACRYCGVEMLSSDESEIEGVCKSCFKDHIKAIERSVKPEDMEVWNYLKEAV